MFSELEASSAEEETVMFVLAPSLYPFSIVN